MKTRRILQTAPFLLLLGFSNNAFGQSVKPKSPTNSIMEGVLNDAGLGHLSSADKAKVIRLLNLALGSSSSSSCPSSSRRAIESEIDGTFNGWDGDTIFKLTNGQIWQQDEYDYEYQYEYNPDVLIFRDGTNWKMKVEGMDETIRVKCIS